ncbi:MAG: hypothetical protein M0P27_02765 [Bacteroidales bacterium]|nr:hypothetical protein [Bacteroidales bacterium]
MKYWIEKTLVNGRKDRLKGDRAFGKALWSPRKDKRGGDIYKNMREVEIGDVIIHLIDNSKIVGISVTQTKAIETTGVLGTEWDRPSYIIHLENFEKLNPEISRGMILNDKNKPLLDEIRSESEVFYTKNLELRQGAYLTPCSPKLFTLINSTYKRLSNKDLPNISIADLPRIEKTDMVLFYKDKLKQAIKNAGLSYSDTLITRFTASLLTKPFLILTGLSGSGKTKLAQAFVKWICQDESQYCIIPVGADWTNREPLLGYPNALKPEEYVKPDSGVLDLIIKANKHPEFPYFLILDEMNLSHVERYFADFLSAMESNEEIPLHSGAIENGVPAKLNVPSNLFIIGTVNIDETTNMFSPKVLDRANTIEFRVTQDEMKHFLSNVKEINMDALSGKGAAMAKSFLEMSANKSFAIEEIEKINATLIQFFGELKKSGAEFGYRSATEILRLINQLTVLDNNLTTNQKIDIAIMQKLLPKLHGSRRKLCPVLEILGSSCVKEDLKIVKDVFENTGFDFNGANVLYPISLEKIVRMYKGAIDNGFASFAEA